MSSQPNRRRLSSGERFRQLGRSSRSAARRVVRRLSGHRPESPDEVIPSPLPHGGSASIVYLPSTDYFEVRTNFAQTRTAIEDSILLLRSLSAWRRGRREYGNTLARESPEQVAAQWRSMLDRLNEESGSTITPRISAELMHLHAYTRETLNYSEDFRLTYTQEEAREDAIRGGLRVLSQVNADYTRTVPIEYDPPPQYQPRPQYQPSSGYNAEFASNTNAYTDSRYQRGGYFLTESSGPSGHTAQNPNRYQSNHYEYDPAPVLPGYTTPTADPESGYHGSPPQYRSAYRRYRFRPEEDDDEELAEVYYRGGYARR